MNLQSGVQNGLWIAVAVLVLIFLVLPILGMGTMAWGMGSESCVHWAGA